MVTKRKKIYMKLYNKQQAVKARKAAYMRKIRAEKRTYETRDMVRFLLDSGYEKLAFDYAKQYAPEMLVTIKSQVKRRK